MRGEKKELSNESLWDLQETIKQNNVGNLRDVKGLIPDHCHNVNITTKWITEYFGFMAHIKVMIILYCSLLIVQ